MTKYQVGDKVTIQHDLRGDELINSIYVAPKMTKFAGRQAIIIAVDTHRAAYTLDIAPQWTWPEDVLDTVKTDSVTISITASTSDEAESKFREAIKKTFDKPRFWTIDEENAAKKFVLDRCVKFTENNGHDETIIFSAPIHENDEQYTTYARILYVHGCWPNKAKDPSEIKAAFDMQFDAGIAKLPEDAGNRPWIGKMFALCNLLQEAPPAWATK